MDTPAVSHVTRRIEPGQVRLSWAEFIGAAHVGMLRFAVSESKRLNHASTYQRTWLERLIEEVIGACGERAWASYSDSYWTGSVDTFHDTPDIGAWEVRSTARSDGCLIIRQNDPPERRYVLVTGEPPTMVIRGWLRGDEARRTEFARNPGGHRDAWFVPQSALHSFIVA